MRFTAEMLSTRLLVVPIVLSLALPAAAEPSHAETRSTRSEPSSASSASPRLGVKTDPPVPCSAPEHRQFDFWLGDWDVYDVADDKTPAAHVRIEKALGDCVIRELYEDGSGLRGESLSIYDAGRSLWSHTWVTNRGQLITLEGRKRGEELLLEGHAITKGVDTLYRAVWTREGEGVRHKAESSVDGGKSWKEWFDLRFRRRKS